MARDNTSTLEWDPTMTEPTTNVTEAAETEAVETPAVPASTVDTVTAESGEPPPARQAARLGWRVRTVLAVLAAALIAVGAGLGYTLYQQSELHRLHEQAANTTRDYLVAMASFDYQNLDVNKAKIAAESTPEFAAKYDEMVGALRDIVVAGKGVATATADHVAVERLDEKSATVLGFVDQQVTNVTAPQGNKQRYRMVVTLVRSGDHWSVDNVETL